ncbi:MAG: hypothetical protein SGJ16_00765 [Nitrospirota bacterium]|nr:hypothetical protein [Nitrospirota bacterium]
MQGDLLRVGLSGQAKYLIELPGLYPRLKMKLQKGLGFLHTDLHTSDTSFLIPIGVDLDFALNQLVNHTSTFLLNFTDIDKGRRTGTNVMPELTFGGMVETRGAMGCPFSLVQGRGTFDVLDLDIPLLLASDSVTGDYRYEGSRLQPWLGPGLDVKASPSLNATTIE